MKSVQKSVHYRRFDPEGGGWSPYRLNQLVSRSLATADRSGGPTIGKDFKKRVFDYPADVEYKWLIHNLSEAEDSVFGTLCLFSPDIYAAVIRRTAAGEHVSLEEALQDLEVAERAPAEGEDFLRGIAYWLVVGNHLFIVQHVALQTKAFEEYFRQLFAAAGLGDRPVPLQSVFDKAIVGGDLGEISAVEIGGVVSRPRPGEDEDTPTKIVEVDSQTSLGGKRLTRFEKAYEVLKTILGAPDAERIMNEVPPDAELEVDVRFGYKSTKRKVSKAALKELAQAARNLPDGEVRAIGKDGKQVGDDMRLSRSMPFLPVRTKSALLDLDDARTKLMRVYQRFVEDAKIDP